MSDKLESSSQLLRKIQHHKGEYISLGEIISIFREGSFSLLLIFFAAPLALPFPAIGIAQIMAIPILVLAIQLTMGKAHPILPQRIDSKKVKTKNLSKVIDKAIPYLEKIETLVKPRLKFFSSTLGHKFVGFICFICAISVALPFPFSNTVPSMGIVLMSIGLLERDGIAIICGICVGFLGICLAITVMYFGVEAVTSIIDEVKKWFMT